MRISVVICTHFIWFYWSFCVLS